MLVSGSLPLIYIGTLSKSPKESCISSTPWRNEAEVSMYGSLRAWSNTTKGTTSQTIFASVAWPWQLVPFFVVGMGMFGVDGDLWWGLCWNSFDGLGVHKYCMSWRDTLRKVWMMVVYQSRAFNLVVYLSETQCFDIVDGRNPAPPGMYRTL